jgi:uncharacterized GH25 family protein
MKYFPTPFLIIGLFFFPAAVIAHTTVLVPHLNKNGQKIIKILHFHPAAGSGLMGIRLDAEDAKDLKGLESIYLIHEKEEKNLDAVAVPDYYTVRGEKGKTYAIPINRKSGFFKPGDYIIIVKHKAHWKEREGLYRRKVAKFCLNYFGVLTDWPNRVLKNMPEIIPLAPPYNVRAGSLFRAEAVNDEGRRIPHAKINIEYLNYPLGDAELDTASVGFIREELADTTVFADGSGSFSFIPPKKGLWTFTLVDGDSNKFIQGEELQYDSSLSILVK